MTPDKTEAEQSLLEFPCDFPIKAMGLHADDFELLVVGIVRRHAPELVEQAIRARPSSNGKYLSVTVIVPATSQAQLDAIYRDLTAHERVMMAL